MARIKPFRAIMPNPFYGADLVFTKPQSESVAGKAGQDSVMPPLKTLLETGARQRPETPEGQQQAYADIRQSLSDLLAGQRLVEDDSAGIYIYEVLRGGKKQTGVWALTDLADYAAGRIRVHEQTLADSVRRLRNYRQHTGLEGSPVLLTYAPCGRINALIAEAKRGPVSIVLANSQGLHRVWKANAQQEALIAAFAQLEQVYLADGHHRLEAAQALAACPDHGAAAVPGGISSLYMATDEVRIEPYDRVVVPEHAYDRRELFAQINRRFHLLDSTGNRPVRPDGPFRMGMYLDRQWYHLRLKSDCCTDTGIPDSELLQRHLLEPVFGINDPRTDSRLKYAGGEKALDEIGALCRTHPAAVAFTLCPLPVAELVSAAGEGRILPPKATWITPKVPYGLLICRHKLELTDAQ